jgi:Cdc6-like AAA superfamily ATPase
MAYIDPEIGFTADVIRDPQRFVGRTHLLTESIKALNATTGLITVYGKRGVGKSSMLRQLQRMATGDYTLAKQAGLHHLIPTKPRSYLTVFYTCDSLITDGTGLASRLCNDQSEEDSLLRLVPNDGKEIVEFSRSKDVHLGTDLKVVQWGARGIETSKYAKTIPGDPVQTLRNYIQAAVVHQVQKRMGRDAILILLDEFDVIADKTGIGSLIKSLTCPEIKFAICGVGRDVAELVSDHASVERLVEQGALPMQPMPKSESKEIVHRAERLFDGRLTFEPATVENIAELGLGFPYLIQLIGKQCVAKANERNASVVSTEILNAVKEDIAAGKAFPTLEQAYQIAIGESEGRQLLLHLLAEQNTEQAMFTDEIGRVVLRKSRRVAEELDIQFIDQLIPRLVDKKYGPVLERTAEKKGTYEFVNPVLRQYICLRRL